MVGGAVSWASISLAGCTGLLDESDGENGDDEEEVPTFVVTDDVLAGPEGIPEGAGGFIVPGRPIRTFVPGMQAVFKIGVWDPETGDIVSDQAIEEATVDLDRNETIDLLFARADREWTGDWLIPDDEETGTVSYDVIITNPAKFTEVGIAQNELEIIEFEPVISNYVVTDDTYAVEDYGDGWVQSCLPQHNFIPGMIVGFDIGIYDGGTGEPVGPDIVDEVALEFETGDPDVVALEWDEDAENWHNSWRGIPEDYEGTINYEVQVTADGEFHQVGVYQGSFEVIEPPADPIDLVESYVVTDDTYATEERGDGYVQSCLPQHNFTPDMPVGFDIGIYDGTTGEPVGPDVVDEAIIVFEAGDPDTVELEWDDEDLLWNAVWRGIPEDYEGTLTYEIQVTNGGEFYRVGVYQDSIFVIQDPAA